MPVVGTKAAASSQGFGEFAQRTAANYIEDVFSTYLYTGVSNTALQIQNGIDLSTKGGMVWIKCRSNAVNHALFDTSRGVASSIQSNSTNAASATPQLGTFNTNGFTHSATPTNQNLDINETSRTFVSWTFRKQPKFFDVVTYTGNGVAGRAITHNLGSAPGFLIVKGVSGTNTSWRCWHRTQANSYFTLNTTGVAQADNGILFGNGSVSVNPTSTNFTVSADGDVNANGATYVAYLFAHDAGGFGASGNDNVISCGSFTQASAVDVNVNLGYEPQWLLIRAANKVNQWYVIDNMRGFLAGSNSTTSKTLYANLTNAEGDYGIQLTSTGFTYPSTQYSVSSADIIYIAIRRGPMKTPTSGASVFYPQTGNSIGDAYLSGVGFAPDFILSRSRQGGVNYFAFTDKLRGVDRSVFVSTGTEVSGLTGVTGWGNDGAYLGSDGSQFYINSSTYNPWSRNFFRRAPGFFDEVCYTGNATNRTINHNLGVVPEMMIVKNRNNGGGFDWFVYHSALGNTGVLVLNTTASAVTIASAWNSTTPTASVFSVGTATNTNGNTNNIVAYLFASCPGVSKVGSYSGTGGTQTISCGFAARFVLIKRTDSTGEWWMWDTARGMVAGTDPRIPLNTFTAETNANWVYTNASGFQIVTTDATVNASGGSYIFLAAG